MLNFTRQQRGEAFDKLPKDIKKVAMSATLAETFQKIGKEQRLAIDKIGILADLVTLTILDLVPRERLVNKISEELGVSGNEANIIAKSVNENVFLKIREILKKEESRELVENEEGTSREGRKAAAPESETDITGSREDILAGLEDPEPVAHPISAVDQTIPGPAKPREIISEEHKAATHDFIANNLAGNREAPAQTAAIELKKKEPEKPKGYAADPYREPTK
jgi:hypothetical protein